jgi:hypothetical protein
MQKSTQWRGMPVWKCSERDVCGEQWAWWDSNTSCPFCHSGHGEPTGFTCGEMLDAAERFGFDDFPVHIPEPVPEVVQLSSLPQNRWVGLPVFHPCGQEGPVANWLLYDVGVVVEVCPDSDFPGDLRCRFVHSMGDAKGILQYGPDNLWVPKVLADLLLKVG